MLKELHDAKGAVEVPCKLCGVTFNIGRVRRPSEPYRAGWSPLCGEPAALPKDWNEGRQWENFVSKDYVTWRRCDVSTGCQDVERKVAPTDSNVKCSDGSDLDSEDDDDYIPETEGDDERLEYTSEVASVEDSSTGDAGSSTSAPDDAFTRQLGTAVDEDSKSFDGGISSTNEIDPESNRGTEDQQHGPSIEDSSQNQPHMAEADGISDGGDSESTDFSECQKLEHLAGPRCEHAGGYCGFNISAEEMKGCTTLQCLVKKTPEWTAEPDDQEYEQSGGYYLSGLCGQMPSRDMGGPTMIPPRHGAEDLYADVLFWDNDEVSPFDGKAFLPIALQLTWGSPISIGRRITHTHAFPSNLFRNLYSRLPSPHCQHRYCRSNGLAQTGIRLRGKLLFSSPRSFQGIEAARVASSAGS